MSVARQKEQGTFDQLLVTPFRPTEIMIGNALSPLLVGTQSVDHRFADRFALVPNSTCRFISYALHWNYCVSVGGGRNRASTFIIHSHDTASTACMFPDHSASHTFVGIVHAVE